MAIINALLADQELTAEMLPDLVFGKMRSKIPLMIEALKGKLSQTQADKIRIALDNFLHLNEKIAKIEALIEEKSQPYQKIIELICTVPGIKKTAAVAIIAEIGTDMSKFFSADHLCSWAGVAPQNYKSAGKRKPVRSGSGNSYLKSMLVQCANAAVREASSWLSTKFGSIKTRRGHNKAIVAICRTMLNAIYYIIHKQEPFREPLKQKAKLISKSEEDKLVNKLQSLGYKIEKVAC